LFYDQERLEQGILQACSKNCPDLIWFEWPRSFEPAFLRQVRTLCPNARLISFQDDNPFGTRHSDSWQWELYMRCVPEFDLHLVKRVSDVNQLGALGARACRIWLHGIYRPLFTPPVGNIEKIYPVSFVGTCFDNRAELLEILIGKHGLPIHVFGTHWQRRSNLPRRFPHLFHLEVTGTDYVQVIHQSMICIGLVSSSHNDEWSLRTFEIPGCATMFLAQRTQVHEAMFREGTEAIFFSDMQECASAIRPLLSEPALAMSIGKAGYARCVADNRFLEARMRELLLTL